MKKVILISIVIISALILESFVKSLPKLVVIVTGADWCNGCKGDRIRIKNEIYPMYNKGNVKFIEYDLSNDSTIKNSQKIMKSLGIVKIAKEISGTGHILFANPGSKRSIKKITIKSTNEEIIKEIENELNKSNL